MTTLWLITASYSMNFPIARNYFSNHQIIRCAAADSKSFAARSRIRAECQEDPLHMPSAK